MCRAYGEAWQSSVMSMPLFIYSFVRTAPHLILMYCPRQQLEITESFMFLLTFWLDVRVASHSSSLLHVLTPSHTAGLLLSNDGCSLWTKSCSMCTSHLVALNPLSSLQGLQYCLDILIVYSHPWKESQIMQFYRKRKYFVLVLIPKKNI